MKYISEVGSKSVEAFKRFPLTSLWAIFGSFYLILMLQVYNGDFLENTRNELLTLSLGISWLIGTQFFIEQFKARKGSWLLNLLSLTLLVVYYLLLPQYSTDNSETIPLRWFLFFLAGHVFMFFEPFVNHWNSAAFWNYLKNIFIALGRGILFSGVLYLGLVFALLAIDALFDINIDAEVYGQIFIFCLGIVNTGIYLSDFPKNIQKNDAIYYNKPLEVFVKFILVPLIFIYLVILYLYSLKILIAWELPEGWISNMITVLAILGFVIQIIIEPVRQNHSSILIRKFFPWFYILLAPLMILLFIAVFRRIADYNFTESRYFLMLLSFWILGTLAYLLISKQKQLRVLPISLFLLIILASFGPWGAFEVSAAAQASEFKEMFSKIDQEEKEITEEQENRILNISRYLASRNQLHRTEEPLGFNPELAFKNHVEYNIGQKILDSLEINTIMGTDPVEGSHYFYRNTYETLIVDLEGHDLFAELQWNQANRTGKDAEYSLAHGKENFEILRDGEIILEFNLDKELGGILSKYGSLHNADPEDLEFDFSNENGSFKLILTNLSFQMEKGKAEVDNITAFLFFRYP